MFLFMQHPEPFRIRRRNIYCKIIRNIKHFSKTDHVITYGIFYRRNFILTYIYSDHKILIYKLSSPENVLSDFICSFIIESQPVYKSFVFFQSENSWFLVSLLRKRSYGANFNMREPYCLPESYCNSILIETCG